MRITGSLRLMGFPKTSEKHKQRKNASGGLVFVAAAHWLGGGLVVWPPAGVAMAAVILRGRSAVVGVAVGAFLLRALVQWDLPETGFAIEALLTGATVALGRPRGVRCLGAAGVAGVPLFADRCAFGPPVRPVRRARRISRRVADDRDVRWHGPAGARPGPARLGVPVGLRGARRPIPAIRSSPQNGCWRRSDAPRSTGRPDRRRRCRQRRASLRPAPPSRSEPGEFLPRYHNAAPARRAGQRV